MAIIRRVNRNVVSYQVKVRDGLGRWFPSETFRTRAAAEAHERLLLVQKDQGQHALPESQRTLTVAEYFALWAAQCRRSVSKGWIISQDQMWRDYIAPVIGARRLLDIRPQEIGMLLDRAVEIRGLKPQTVKHLYAFLHKLFEDAVEHYGWMNRNPVLGRYRPKIPIRERAFLTPQESWTLLEHVRNHYLGPAVWLQVLSGLRPSEVQGLRWQSVDFERGQILICAAYNNKEKRFQEHPKQSDWGMAPMPPKLSGYLRELKALRNAQGSDLVAQSIDGQRLPYGTYQRALRGLCDGAGVKRVTPHELRHSCTELYVQAGASAEDIRRLLNQSSLTATARYLHRTDERLQGLAAKVGGQSNPSPASPTAGQASVLRVVR